MIIREIERRQILKDHADRDSLLERLSVLLPETQSSCYAWVLMSNHPHFLLRSGTEGISQFMRRWLMRHAVNFNRRHGQLFQDRYKSILVELSAKHFRLDADPGPCDDGSAGGSA